MITENDLIKNSIVHLHWIKYPIKAIAKPKHTSETFEKFIIFIEYYRIFPLKKLITE